MRILYGIKCGRFIKIGVTDHLKARMFAMKLMNPHPCEVVIAHKALDAYEIERRVHAALAPYGIGREWFAVDLALARSVIKIVRNDLKRERLNRAIECYDQEVLRGVTVGTQQGD